MNHFQTLFHQQYSEIYGRTYRFVAMRVGRVEDAEDVTAETLIAAWKGLKTYDEHRAELMTWILSIAKHKIADSWRKQKDVPWDDALFAALPDEQRVSLNDVLDSTKAFQEIMDSLPQHLRTLLALRHIDGLSHEEIATIVSHTPDAVRQRLSRLHKKLHTQFPHYDLND